MQLCFRTIGWLVAGLLVAASAQAGLEDTQIIGFAGKCLDVRGGGDADGTLVVLFRCQGNPNQRWDLPPRAFSGEVRGLADKCLDVTGGVSQDRATVEIRTCNGAPSQQWRFGQDGRIVGIGGRCLDVLDADPSDLAEVGIFTCHGQSNQLWQPYVRNRFLGLGPEAGPGYGFLRVSAAEPSVLLADFQGQLYRSEDRGESWSSLADLSAERQRALWLVDQAGPVLLDPIGAAYYRSEDDGQTWNLVRPPFDSVGVALDPTRPRSLWALDRAGQSYRSRDAGNSWDRLGLVPVEQPGLASARFFPDPGNSSYLLLSTWSSDRYGHPIPIDSFRSSDGGNTWHKVGASCVFEQVSFDPHDSRWLFGDCDGTLSRSSDRGETWAVVATLDELGLFRTSWIFDPLTPGRLLAASSDVFGTLLLSSLDRGMTWTSIPVPSVFDSQSAITLLGATPDDGVAYVLKSSTSPIGGAGELYRSTDWGGSWKQIGRGLRFPRFEVVIPDPSTPGRAYAQGDSGLAVTEDGGATWEPRAVPASAEALAVDPRHAGHLLIGHASSVYRSSDGGRSFQLSTLPVPDSFIDRLAYDPLLGTTTYAVATRLSQSDLFRSDDGGASWRRLRDVTFFRDFALDADGRRIYVATYGNLLISPDGGQSWIEQQIKLESLAADSTQAGTIWGCADSDVFLSRDGGATWSTLAGPEGSGARGCELSAAMGVVVLASTGGVWRSVDGGQSWSSIAAGWPGYFDGIALDPNRPERLWATRNAYGIFVGDFDLDLPPAGSILGLVDHRFQLSVAWRDFQGNAGIGTAVPLTGDTGAFWFFGPANLELMVKVLDGRAINGHFWVFYGALSNVEFTLTVRDTATGQERVYVNQLGKFASRGDTEAF